jgi:hypothetical protein
MIVKLHKGAEHPDIALTWRDSNAAIIDFATGYTFELKIGNSGSPALFEKTVGMTGAQTSPNVTIIFIAGELDALPAGRYEAQLRARQTSSSKDRFMRFWFYLLPAIEDALS